MAQGLLKIFFHLWDSIGQGQRIGERRALLAHHDLVMVSPVRTSLMRYFGLGGHSSPENMPLTGSPAISAFQPFEARLREGTIWRRRGSVRAAAKTKPDGFTRSSLLRRLNRTNPHAAVGRVPPVLP
jgi:hypothetical protein